MRRKISVILIVVICFLLQSTLFSALSFASISPNLLIVVVSSFGFMRGRKEGMWIGLFCGVLRQGKIFDGGSLRQRSGERRVPERERRIRMGRDGDPCHRLRGAGAAFRAVR